jgi:hypothetical protein
MARIKVELKLDQWPEETVTALRKRAIKDDIPLDEVLRRIIVKTTTRIANGGQK